MKNITILLFTLTMLPANVARPQTAVRAQAGSEVVFDKVADDALAAMRARAAELKIEGAAVVAFMPGDSLQSWTSKMVVVGRYKNLPSATDKGSNLLGIAYAKAAEMADTLKDSGSQVRPPMTGEFGWQGGAIIQIESGYLIAAFSGGKSEEDLQVSHAGLERLKAGYSQPEKKAHKH